ncbi:MAG TPA: hypothetical protein VNA66_05345 [Gammaproteobacteria bacterium]|nr:hypothetical protein [Gammaproteobacteria bacterium]
MRSKVLGAIGFAWGIAGFVFPTLVPASALAQKSYLLPPDALVANQTQEDWSRSWWQWAASFERAESPVADTTGEQCGGHQSGDVWFLAGTYETKRTFRTCRVPRDKHLFFPLINYVVMPSRKPISCEAVTNTAARMTEAVSNLVLRIDGERFDDLTLHRQATRECFDIGELLAPPVRMYPSAANGYYAMLRPLPPGKHVIDFGGILPSMAQAITYTLTVE